MGTPWSQDEYQRVARALLYPLSSSPQFPSDYFSADPELGFVVGGLLFRLQTVRAEVKPTILTLANKVNTAHDAFLEQASGDCANLDLLGVGNVKRDPKGGLSLRAKLIEAMRERLASSIPIEICPWSSAARLTEFFGSAISGTWAP